MQAECSKLLTSRQRSNREAFHLSPNPKSLFCILADGFFKWLIPPCFLHASCHRLLVLQTGVFSRSMHDDWCFRIAVYGGAQSSGINTYWERVLCIVTDTLVPDARSWMQRAQKKLKISCSARLKQLIIFCCTMLCISAGQNQLPHVTILLSDWLRKRNKPSELTCLSGAVVDADGDGQEFDPLFSSHQDETKVCSEDVFFPRPILLAVRRWWGPPGISGIPKQSQGRSYLLFWRRAFVEESRREQVVVGRFKQIGSADLFPQCCTPAYWWHDFISKLRDVEISK